MVKLVSAISLIDSSLIRCKRTISTNWQRNAHGQTTYQNLPQFPIRGLKL